MTLMLRRTTVRKPAPAGRQASPRPMSRDEFVGRQVKHLLNLSAMVAKQMTASTKPVPTTGPTPARGPQFARGGAVDHGSMSPDAQASGMLKEQGIDRPSVSAIHHLSAELGVKSDPVRVALALAQSSHADGNGYSLSNLEALHDLNHAASRAGSPQTSPMHGVVGPARGLHPAVAAAFAAMEPEAAQRGSFAQGGAISGPPPYTPMHPAVAAAFAAMNQRPHFDDGGGEGGGAGGGDSSHSSGGGSSSGGEGGSSSSGGEGGGGGGDSGGDGHGSSDNSSSNSNSSSSGGHSDASTGGGGSGDGGSEGGSSGGGGGFSSGAASGSDSGSSGGRSDASSSGGYGGGSSSSDASPSGGGFSSGAASGADTSGMGGGVSGGYGSATSGDVGSIGGSAGAPAAGGFSGAGEAATGGFGSFGPGPAASDNMAGMSGATPTASSISGQTAQQSMASEASSGGDPGEDGTGSGLGGVTTAGAFGSFGPSPASPYGSTANTQGAFNGTQASDLSGAAGLSPMGQQLGMMGLGSMPSGEMANPNGFASPGAYGLSTAAAGVTPGFDNFSNRTSTSDFGDASPGVQQQSSLGPQGYSGSEADSPSDVSSSFQGNMPGSMVNAMYGGLPGAEAQATDLGDLSKGFNPDYSGFALGPDGKPTYAGNMGVFSGLGGPAAGSEPTGGAAGLNADGDPTAVSGTSALTIHGNQTEAAQGGYDAPGPATTYGGITDKQAFDARQGVIANGGVATPAQAATISGYTAQQNSPVGRTVGLGNVAASVGAAPAAATAAAGDATAGSGAGTDAGTGVGAGSSVGAPAAGTSADDPASQPGQPPSLTVSGLPTGGFYASLHTIEGGVLDGKVDPNNPGHYGPAQFSQPTFSDTVAAHPELGISPGMSMFSATPEQYAGVTQAHVQDVQSALRNAGFEATPANTYLGWNSGITGAIRALSAGPDASLAQAGISPAVQRANPSIYGGVSTVGQLQAHIAGMFSGVQSPAAPTTQAPITVHSMQEAMGTGSPAVAAGLGINGVAPGVPTKTGVYGTPVAHDYATPDGFTSDNFTAAAATGHITDPSSLSMFGAMAGAAYGVGVNAKDGTENVQGAMPTSMQGITNFDGTPTTYGTGTAADTTSSDPDAPAPSHLSVPTGLTNFGANLGLGMLGPIGMGLAGANMVSGFMGGPTVGSMVNGAMAAIGSGSGGGSAGYSSGGNGDNSNQPGRDGDYNQPVPTEIAQATPSGNVGISSSGGSASTSSGTSDPAALTIHRIHQLYGVPRANSGGVYNPLTDPAVMRALAAMKS